MWGGLAYFNSYSTSQRGLAVLFRDSLPSRDVKTKNVIKGNYMRLTFNVNKRKNGIKPDRFL